MKSRDHGFVNGPPQSNGRLKEFEKNSTLLPQSKWAVATLANGAAGGPGRGPFCGLQPRMELPVQLRVLLEAAWIGG